MLTEDSYSFEDRLDALEGGLVLTRTLDHTARLAFSRLFSASILTWSKTVAGVTMEDALGWRTTLFRKVLFEGLFVGNITQEVRRHEMEMLTWRAMLLKPVELAHPHTWTFTHRPTCTHAHTHTRTHLLPFNLPPPPTLVCRCRDGPHHCTIPVRLQHRGMHAY